MKKGNVPSSYVKFVHHSITVDHVHRIITVSTQKKGLLEDTMSSFSVRVPGRALGVCQQIVPRKQDSFLTFFSKSSIFGIRCDFSSF